MAIRLNLLWVECISQTACHSAFTDLIFFQGAFLCAFRQASGHMSLDGEIVILTSQDGEKWRLLQRLSWVGGDLRDPKFVVDRQGNLLLLSGLRQAVYSQWLNNLVSLTWRFDAGRFAVVDLTEGTWRWSAALLDSQLYSVGYARKDFKGTLYRMHPSSAKWDAQVVSFFPDSGCFSNESSLLFEPTGQTAYCLLRRDGKACPAVLGEAKAPFRDWRWRDLNHAVGGPKLLLLDCGKCIAAYRLLQEGDAVTVIAQLDLSHALLDVICELPSSGDCSYPGMVQLGDFLYVSYYSSHQQETAVYFAKLALD